MNSWTTTTPRLPTPSRVGARTPLQAGGTPVKLRPEPSSPSPIKATQSKDRYCRIYKWKRTVGSIVGTIPLGSNNEWDSELAPTLGYPADQYLIAHGYDDDARTVIANIFNRSGDHDLFADHLNAKDMAYAEASYLFDLITDGLNMGYDVADT